MCLACQDFLLRQTALRKGRSEGIPKAEATTANALQREGEGEGGREGGREGENNNNNKTSQTNSLKD